MNPIEKSDCVLVRWAPSRNSDAAILTLLGMTAAYAVLGANPNNMGVAALIGLIVVPLLAVGVPVYWTTMVDRQPISALGLTTHRWLPSLALSVLLCMVTFFPLLVREGSIVSMEKWLPMAVAGALALFEPLFVFGWLQLRFEKDFGILPGILLAAFGFAFYHIFYVPQAFQGQFADAIMFAVFFRLTGSLLVVWPLLWAATSAWYCIGGIGTSGCFYSWPMVISSALALLIEVAFIAFMASRQRRGAGRAVPAHA